MDFAGYLPFPDKELGGGADYDNATMIPMGLAVLCRNMRFRKRSVRTRDGYLHTMSYAIQPGVSNVPAFDFTGIEALDVLVNNPRQVVIASTSRGDLLQESPVGSGTMSALAPPFSIGAWPIINVAATQVGGNTLVLDLAVGGTTLPAIGASVTIQNLVTATFLNGVTFTVTGINGDVVVGTISSGHATYGPAVDSGSLGPANPAIGVSMQTAKAYNRIHMAFSDLQNALSQPLVYDGPTGVISPISQNPTGAIWTPGRNYLVGDTVRTSQNPNRWFRCIVAGRAGNIEPTWPILDGYFTAVAGPISTSIISVQWVPGFHSGGSSQPSLSIATVASTSGFSVGGSITVAGCSDPNFDGTWTIYSIGSNSIAWQQAGLAFGETGTGGTISGTSTNTPLQNPATATDPNGASQWIEWTPAVPQFVPAPEGPELIISVKGQAGAPSGTISVGQDVYVCFAYQNANGESAWTQPIVFLNTAASDVLEVFFQQQNEKPGPTVAAAFGAAGYGGPRMPNWLMSVLGASDPTINWPNFSSLNVYVNAVTHGDPAPSSYGQFSSGQAVTAPVVITSIPTTASFIPRQTPTAALNQVPFTGAGGPRYLAVARQDSNESLVPIDPGSPLLVNLTSSIAASGTAQILFIQRSNNVVTCTVDLMAGFAQGAEVVIENVVDTSFNGTFALIGVSPTQFGGATLIWQQSGSSGASTGGTATSASASTAFVIPQILIATIARVSNVVTAVVNSLQGLAVGTVIAVQGVTDTSFDGGPFTITVITPNLGGGGSVSWAQTAADATSSGGQISVTGAAVGTNQPQNISELVRGRAGGMGIAGQVNCFFFGNGTTPAPGFAVGAQVVVAGASPSDLNGTFTITFVGAVSNLNGSGWGITWNQTGAAETATAPGTCTLLTQGTTVGAKGNTSSISRASGVVTATVDNATNFTVGGRVNVSGVSDTSYNGTFVLTSVDVSTGQLQWLQPGANSSSSGGSIIQTSGGPQQPAPVAVLPPGGQFISQDIAAFTVQGGSVGGPFNFIPSQDPVTPFSTSIVSIGAVTGTVTALLKDASGLQPGFTIQLSGTPNGWFDGVFVVAQVNGNTIVFAGNGPGTGFTGGTVTLVPTQPTVAFGQNDPLTITSMSRLASGLVSAQFNDVSNLEPGMRIQVAGATDTSFNGIFQLLSVSQNQLPGSTTPLAGTVTWQSSTLSAASTTGGLLTGLPGIIFNPDDNELANASNVTAQLSSIGAPSCVDLFFSQALNMMVYTIGQDSSHYFSNPGDVANIANPGGILGVNESNGERTVCFREMISGELISLKEKSGYEITVGTSTPNQWGVSRRWGASQTSDGHGPCSARAVDVADDFLIYFDMESGPYRYQQGRSIQVGQEKQGTWDRINRAAAQQICVAIDSVRKEVHFGLPLDGATVPNHDLVLNYFNGWNEPLMLTMSGELMPDPHGRRWSDNDISDNGGNARLIKVLKRTLPTPASQQIARRQVVFCLAGIATPTGATTYVNMSVPDQFNDNGLAINAQYQPAFAQSPTCEVLLWDKSKGRVLGSGSLSIQPTTEDSDESIQPVYIQLDEGDSTELVPKSFEKAFSQINNEMLSLIYSNQQNGTPIVNTWFELHRSVRYAKPSSSGTRR